MTHICVSKLTIIGSDNGLSPERRQAIMWPNAGILLIGPLRTNFNEILKFVLKKMRLKVSSAKWRPFCVGLNVLRVLRYVSNYGFLTPCFVSSIVGGLLLITIRILWSDIRSEYQRNRWNGHSVIMALSRTNKRVNHIPCSLMSNVDTSFFNYAMHSVRIGTIYAHLYNYINDIRGCLIANVDTSFSNYVMHSVRFGTIHNHIESIKTTSMEDVSTRVLEKIKNI